MPLVNPPLPGIQISGAIPLKVGGSPSAGGGGSASAYNHVHALQETSGPTNLDLGGILTGEMVRRVAAALVGRQIDVLRLTSNSSSTSTAPADVSADLSVSLKAATNYLVWWIFSYVTAATTTGLRVGMNYSGTLGSNTLFALLGATSPTAMQNAATGTNDALLGQAGVGPGSLQ